MRQGAEIRIDTYPTNQICRLTDVLNFLVIILKYLLYVMFTFEPSESRENKTFLALMKNYQNPFRFDEQCVPK